MKTFKKTNRTNTKEKNLLELIKKAAKHKFNQDIFAVTKVKKGTFEVLFKEGKTDSDDIIIAEVCHPCFAQYDLYVNGTKHHYIRFLKNDVLCR